MSQPYYCHYRVTKRRKSAAQRLEKDIKKYTGQNTGKLEKAQECLVNLYKKLA